MVRMYGSVRGMRRRRLTLLADIRLVDEDEDSYTFWNIDVSTQDIVVTLDNLD